MPNFDFFEFRGILNTTQGKYNKRSYNNDIQNFIRRIKLKAHFKATEVLNKNNGNLFIKTSANKQQTLKETHHTFEILIKAFKNELQTKEQI